MTSRAGTGRLAGKVAVITGATSGLGRAGAVRFAAKGAKVVAASRREAEGKEVVDEIEGAGGEAVFVPCDVTESDDVRDLIAAAEERFGSVHVLYASAGVMHARVRSRHDGGGLASDDRGEPGWDVPAGEVRHPRAGVARAAARSS